MNVIRATNKAESNLMAARADWREARHYCEGARQRARRTAKREAHRAARRVPIDVGDVLTEDEQLDARAEADRDDWRMSDAYFAEQWDRVRAIVNAEDDW